MSLLKGLKNLTALALLFVSAAHAEKGVTKFGSQDANFKLEVIREGKDVVWGFDFLPDGRIIFTEREGKMFLFDPKTGKETPVLGLPKADAADQSGMLDVRLHPKFSANHLVFFVYTKRVDGKLAMTLVRAELLGATLSNLKEIFVANPPAKSSINLGSRILFENDKTLFLSIGDGDDRFRAQDWKFYDGKILRLTIDGKPAPGNPFLNTPGARPEIWSYGHRNPQGLALHPNGTFFEAEFGPKGGDEVNIVKKGLNYGWPIITYGREYSGPKIGEGPAKRGMEQPVVYWVPSISPSGIDFYRGENIAKWKNNLFLGCLSGNQLRRVVLNEKNEVVKQEELLTTLGWRIRNVRSGPDGFLYISTDEGKIARIIL